MLILACTTKSPSFFRSGYPTRGKAKIFPGLAHFIIHVDRESCPEVDNFR